MSDELPPARPGATVWDRGEPVEFEQRGNRDVNLRSCGRCAAVVSPRDEVNHAAWHYGQDRLFEMIRVTVGGAS